jgi:hypothetical protein
LFGWRAQGGQLFAPALLAFGPGPFAAPAAPIARDITSRSRHADSGVHFGPA